MTSNTLFIPIKFAYMGQSLSMYCGYDKHHFTADKH